MTFEGPEILQNGDGFFSLDFIHHTNWGFLGVGFWGV